MRKSPRIGIVVWKIFRFGPTKYMFYCNKCLRRIQKIGGNCWTDEDRKNSWAIRIRQIGRFQINCDECCENFNPDYSTSMPELFPYDSTRKRLRKPYRIAPKVTNAGK